MVMGYAGTTRFRPKAAYETTVETTIYCAPEAVGKGIGRRLYAELFEMLRGEDIHRFVAGYVAAECGERGAASAIRIQGGGRVQREWAEVREVLGCVLGGTGRVKTRAGTGLAVIFHPL